MLWSLFVAQHAHQHHALFRPGFAPSSTLRLAGRDVRTLLQFQRFSYFTWRLSCESKTTLNDLWLYPCKSFKAEVFCWLLEGFTNQVMSSHSYQFHVKFFVESCQVKLNFPLDYCNFSSQDEQKTNTTQDFIMCLYHKTHPFTHWLDR